MLSVFCNTYSVQSLSKPNVSFSMIYTTIHAHITQQVSLLWQHTKNTMKSSGHNPKHCIRPLFCDFVTKHMQNNCIVLWLAIFPLYKHKCCIFSVFDTLFWLYVCLLCFVTWLVKISLKLLQDYVSSAHLTPTVFGRTGALNAFSKETRVRQATGSNCRSISLPHLPHLAKSS